MIFTSYFGKLRKFPKNVFPVAICAKVPDWYAGARYMELAPPYELLMQWKCDHRNDSYEECFNSMVLGSLDTDRVLDELHQLLPAEVRKGMTSEVCVSPVWHIALLCYERPDDFCHRHLVAAWLRRSGYDCEEWEEK